MTADRHADALFEAKYGFCRIDCDLCKRLDEEAKARPDYDREAAVEAGWKLAMCANSRTKGWSTNRRSTNLRSTNRISRTDSVPVDDEESA
jgi:hypothetical protein